MMTYPRSRPSQPCGTSAPQCLETLALHRKPTELGTARPSTIASGCSSSHPPAAGPGGGDKVLAWIIL